MKLNNLMKQTNSPRSVRGSVARAGVLAAVGTTSSDGPVVAASASFS